MRFVDINAVEASEALECYKIACGTKTTAKGGKRHDSTERLPPKDVTVEQSTETTQPLDGIDGLEAKVDTVIDILKKLSTKIEEPPPRPSFSDVSTIAKELSTADENIDWNAIENIIELTENVPTIRFFSGQFSKKGCVRCEICFNHIFCRDAVSTKRDPLLVEDDDGQAIATHIKK